MSATGAELRSSLPERLQLSQYLVHLPVLKILPAPRPPCANYGTLGRLPSPGGPYSTCDADVFALNETDVRGVENIIHTEWLGAKSWVRLPCFEP